MATREQLHQWFYAIDKSRDGKLDVKELQQALAKGGLNFSLKTVAKMIE